MNSPTRIDAEKGGRLGTCLAFVALGVLSTLVGLVWLLTRPVSTSAADEDPGSTSLVRTRPSTALAVDSPSNASATRTEIEETQTDSPQSAEVSLPRTAPASNEGATNPIVLIANLDRQHDPSTRLAAAGEILTRNLGGALVGRALETLAQLEPSSVAEAFRRMVEAPAKDDRARDLGRWIRMLGNRRGALSSADLRDLFAHGSDEVRQATAWVLSTRGDESLPRRWGENTQTTSRVGILE